MSAGNTNTNGNKKRNFPYQFKVLQLLGAISGTSGAGATEATLQSVLSAIQDGQDFEAKLVVDNNGNGNTYLEVRIWNPDTQTWETPLYYAPGSNTGVPLASLTAPVVYINPNTLLAQIANALAGAVRTPNNVITSGGGSVPAGSLRGSVINTGNAAGTWNGISIPAGVSIPWGVCGENDTYGAIAYDATGTTFVIEYTT